MTGRFHRHDQPLTSKDLSKCQAALERYCHQAQMEQSSPEGQRAGAIISELFQQGIHDEQRLNLLLDTARGYWGG